MSYSARNIALEIYQQTVAELDGARLVKERISISREADGGFSWEKIDLADKIKKAVG